MHKKRGELAWDTLIPWIIGVAFIVLIFILYTFLSSKGINVLEYIKNLIRFKK
ncbi:MAG: hypothetical protein AABX73_01955 [Nanoarchaeota archaeon]